MIQIKEGHDPLVDIKTICPDIVINLGKHRMKNEKTAYLRKTVAQILCRAKSHLPPGMTFLVRDAWRPQKIQQEIYHQFFLKASKKYPSWSQQKIKRSVGKYVAPAQGKYASGHMTGAAIDVRIIKNGKKLPMNSSKLTYSENAQSLQPKLPLYIQKNRQIMFNALTKAGLSNYPKEYWHWSYGDIWWAKRNNEKTAVYGVTNHTC